MKTEILKILQMQQEGKLTQDQAAELLAMLADQAREKDGASTQCAPSTGAPGPRGASSGGAGGGFNATAALHDLMDTAIGMGASVGRAATVLGGELVNMVHRDEGGNSVTLSKVDSPSGDAFTFRGNTFNVSKVSHLAFNQAEVCGNSVNASKVAHLAITRGRFSQCAISGSSVHQVTIEGPSVEALAAPGGSTMPATGIRALTFSASKFSRVNVLGGSVLESTAFQAAAVKDLNLTEGSSITGSRVSDANITGLSLERAHFKTVKLERLHAQMVAARDVTLENTVFADARMADVKITGGTWNDVKFHREMGGKASSLEETQFENCTLSGCEFLNCTFRRTTLRGLKLSGVMVRNVDFTGMVLETEEAFRKAAGV